MTCNSRCTHAKGDLCRCECEGANHGIYADDEDLEENKEETLESEGIEEAITNIPLFEEEEIIHNPGDGKYKSKHEEFLENKRIRRAEIERNKPGLVDAKEKKEIIKKQRQSRRKKESTFRKEQKERIKQKKITDFKEVSL